MLAHVRDVPLEPGAGPLRFPGETGAEARSQRLRTFVPVQPFCCEQLEHLSRTLGVPMPAPCR